MRRKLTAILMALAMVLSLVSCGGGEKPSSEAGQSESEAVDSAETTVSGQVTAADDTSLTIQTESGESRTVALTEKTQYTIPMTGKVPGQPDGEAPTDGNAPEKPDGEAPTDGNAPEKPDGEAPTNGNVPEKPDGGRGQEVMTGMTVTVTLDSDGNAAAIEITGMPEGMGGGMDGGSAAPTRYNAAQEVTEDTELTGETVTAQGTDENALLLSKDAVLTVSDSEISRLSENSTGGDNASFYGVGAAVLATEGTAVLNGCTITTDAPGGAGVFAYGNGTAYVSDSAITTAQSCSGGIHVSGGGTLYAKDLTVETEGESSAAIRSDRGGGTMVVDGGSYTSHGTGSPAVYSTADITVKNAELRAEGSEAVCIEGMNALRLFDCKLTGNMSDLEQNDCTWNVILYQSMSGDSQVGNSTFQMEGGTLTAQNGGMFYTTNTESTFILKNVNIINSENAPFVLKCTGNTNARGWGQTGSNGADCNFTAIEQALSGNVLWDSISQLDLYLTEGSSLTGAVVQDDSAAGDGTGGACRVYVSKDSTWTVTADSTVSRLQCEGTLTDMEGRSVTVRSTDGSVLVQGDSDVSVTVEKYNDTADLSGAAVPDAEDDDTADFTDVS